MLKSRELTTALGLALVFALAFSACSYNPDEDGDGSFNMDGESNSSNSYDYKFLNKSSYEVTVTVGKRSGQKTKTLKAHSIFATTITQDVSRTTVKYSPADKVKPDGGGPTVSFKNR
jgi:hypothetical protein